jgi:hypothetical protein
MAMADQTRSPATILNKLVFTITPLAGGTSTATAAQMLMASVA